MAGTGKAFVRAPGEGRSIDLGAFEMTVKASGDETGGLFSLLEAGEPPRFGRRSKSITTPPKRLTSSKAST